MKKPLLLVIAVTVAVASVWGWKRTGEPVEAARNRLLVDRIWIDHVPHNDKDTINVFALVSKQAAGVFQATSQWRGSYEVFRYEAEGADLRLVYPQTGDREAVRAKAKRCTEGRMDFCLEIEGASRGVKKYYSREGWEIKQGRALDAVTHQIDALRARLAASE